MRTPLYAPRSDVVVVHGAGDEAGGAGVLAPIAAVKDARQRRTAASASPATSRIDEEK